MKNDVAQKSHKEHLVVGHFNDFAIVKNDIGNIYYIKGNKPMHPIGMRVDEERLLSIHTLSSKEKLQIMRMFGNYDL